VPQEELVAIRRCRKCLEKKRFSASRKGRRLCEECVAPPRSPEYERKLRRLAELNEALRGVAPEERDLYRTLYVKYGVTPAHYDELLKQQGGLCAICKQPGKKRLAVDHDHVSGQVRGLLCSGCNIGLGHFRDSTSQLRAAAEYLETFHE